MKRWIFISLLCGGLCGGCTWMKQRWPLNRWADAEPAGQPWAASGPDGSDLDVATAPPAPPAGIDPADPYAGHTLLGEPTIVEAFMIQVNDQIITVNDVLHAVRRELRDIPAGVSEENFRQQAVPIITREIQRQVGEALLVRQARRELSDEDKARIDRALEAELREAIAQAGGSRMKLDHELRAQGTTLAEWTELRRRRMTSQYATRRRFLPQLAVTRAQLWRYYQSHLEEFSSPRQVKMQILAVPFREFYPPGTQRPTALEMEAIRQQARAHAEQAMAQARAGADFTELVKAMGKGYLAEQGGLWDYMPAGSFRESVVEQAAFAQSPGQVSGILDGQDGLFLVRTVDVRGGTVVPFEQAQHTIDEKLREEQYDALAAKYIQELYDKATVIQADQFQELVLEQAVKRHNRP